MEIRYVPDDEFVLFIKSHGIGEGATLTVLDGKNVWQITEDGETYIVRPESARV